VSAEAPVPVIAVRREQKAIGCVGNLARNLASLDAHCLFVVVIGATRDEKDCQQLSRLGAQPGRGSDWVRFEKWMELAVAETKPAASAAAIGASGLVCAKLAAKASLHLVPFADQMLRGGRKRWTRGGRG
jgi:hypothetical protein